MSDDEREWKQGDRVGIIAGPFERYEAEIVEVLAVEKRAMAAILVFGKPTSIELSFDQMRRV